MNKICSYTTEEFEEKAKAFHGFVAPGIIVGGFMVDLAYRQLPSEGLFDTISETRKCLPDSIQLLTPCSIGNGWLKIINSGRYAMSMYNKENGEGVRVYLDLAKLGEWPTIKEWFLNLKPKKEQDSNRLYEEIWSAGTSIFGCQKIKVNLSLLGNDEKFDYAVCPKCKECYPKNGDDVCLGCQGIMPFSDVCTLSED